MQRFDEEITPTKMCLACAIYEQDLQLAAELGKTLLERNKELETTVKQHQNIIEDQTQEIEYLTKQTVALREVNDSRLRIYEQLEVSIHELERANHRLTLDNAVDKKQIKNLYTTIGTLESRCDELQTTIEQMHQQLDIYKRKWQQLEDSTKMHQANNSIVRRNVAGHYDLEDDEFSLQDKQIQCDNHPKSSNQYTTAGISNLTYGRKDSEHQQQILTEQLNDFQLEHNRQENRIAELEQQIATLVQENQSLENQVLHLHNNANKRDDDTKSIHDEFNSLDEVRQGQLCVRCLRNIDEQRRNVVGQSEQEMEDEEYDNDDDEEDDEDNLSMMNALISTDGGGGGGEIPPRYQTSISLNIQQEQLTEKQHQSTNNNLYRDLVEKYEALLAVNRGTATKSNSNSLSLQEELEMSGEFTHFHQSKGAQEEEEETTTTTTTYQQHALKRQQRHQTPTDFSEAETSSSGFADETSNKSTQTDGRPGAFLCTIADGEDCRFSIYDDTSPIDSRFRNRPEYRELFKEIFTVLKKAAENKDEGEQLPLLDDCTPVVPKVPPVTPATEEFPCDFTDDNQSIISDVSSRSNNEAGTLIEEKEESQFNENKQQQQESIVETKNDVILTPYKREPLEYLTVSVNVRKKKNNKKFSERSDSPILPLSPRISYASRKQRIGKDVPVRSNSEQWNGTTLQFWSTNRNVPSPTPSEKKKKNKNAERSNSCSGWDFKPSTASQDLNKLKRLDLSYAEVLRNANNTKREREALAKNKRK